MTFVRMYSMMNFSKPLTDYVSNLTRPLDGGVLLLFGNFEKAS